MSSLSVYDSFSCFCEKEVLEAVTASDREICVVAEDIRGVLGIQLSVFIDVCRRKQLIRHIFGDIACRIYRVYRKHLRCVLCVDLSIARRVAESIDSNRFGLRCRYRLCFRC